MRYDVNVSRISTATLTIRVEADTAEQAEEKAVEQAHDTDFTGCVVEYDFEGNGAVPVDGDEPNDGNEDPEPPDNLVCFFCGAEKPTVEAAVEAGWTPSFFIGGEWQGEPVCGDCYVKYLMADESGEDVLKPEYAEGQYVSVWDSGVEHTSHCIVNAETREVEICQSYEKDDDDQLVEEYVMVGGVKHQAAHADERADYAPDEQARMFFWK